MRCNTRQHNATVRCFANKIRPRQIALTWRSWSKLGSTHGKYGRGEPRPKLGRGIKPQPTAASSSISSDAIQCQSPTLNDSLRHVVT
ncbi:UNVERIFIED_CONTAM: hypothetical protein Sradi_1326900 [Sesamum radiatum]|uniref:Uncharacterized protein n=1 Tax=Sesamum radiatum TaxID=300843 RepID=A0AAW2UQ10_SESRA